VINTEKVNYTVIKISDRAIDNFGRITEILSDFNYINNIKFYNGHVEDCKKIINECGINTDSWNSVLFGEKSNRDPLPGELGVTLSVVSILNYIIENSLDYLLVLEDDAILEDDAKEKILNSIKDLPLGWDFLSLFSLEHGNLYTEDTDVGSEYVHKSNNQGASTVVMAYSLEGAKKMLKLLKAKGMEGTIDCFMYKQSVLGLLNGYSVKPNIVIARHINEKHPSTIDPDDLRLTFYN
jgi:GR25 family glycosyltransferase involved in LPS biosynthesis